jgi:hypothetical protein
MLRGYHIVHLYKLSKMHCHNIGSCCLDIVNIVGIGLNSRLQLTRYPSRSILEN